MTEVAFLTVVKPTTVQYGDSVTLTDQRATHIAQASFTIGTCQKKSVRNLELRALDMRLPCLSEERGRFELPERSSRSAVFKTAALNHSATSPRTASAAFMRNFRMIA
jgi:hypothetical protein